MPAAESLIAALADRYRIVRELGEGGMATVYLAEDLKHHRQVAIKVLKPQVAATLGGERFLQEIEIGARLEHPHILTLIDSGNAAGSLYYVMPFVDGESLRERVDRDGQLPLEDVVRILRDVSDAVAFAHRSGVVHRDIKPDNIMLSNRHASVMDFGIAKALSSATGASHLTAEGMSLGTPAYMAPEQVAADPNVDHRADLYAIGAVAYELLAGRPPFVASTPQRVLAAHVTEEPEPVTALRPDTPAELADVVMACLVKRPDARPSSAGDVLAVLESPSVRLSVSQLPSTASRRPRMGSLIFAMLAATVIIAGVFALIRTRTPPRLLDPNVVAVLPFRVSSPDASLDYLREGMMDLLAAMMTGEGGSRASDPRTVMAAFDRHGGSSELTEVVARDIAADVGAGLLILGGIVTPPGQLVVTAKLISTTDGTSRAEARVVGTQEELQGVLDRLTAQLLAQEAGEQAYRLASLTTTSLAALRLYLDGQAAYRHARYYDAERLFDSALQEDPNFALAALWKVFAVDWTGTSIELERTIEAAWAIKDRLSSKDQALLEGWAGPKYPGRSSTEDHILAWNRALQLAPDHVEAWFSLGDHYLHDGPVAAINGWRSHAEDAFSRAVALDSTFAPALGHLVEIAAVRDDTAGVRRLDRLYTQAAAGSEIGPFNEWLAARALGDEARLQKLRDAIPSMHPDAVWRIVAQSVLWGRGLEEGELGLAALPMMTTTPYARLITAEIGSRYLLERGRPSASTHALDSTTTGVSEYLSTLVLNAVFSDGDRGAAQSAVDRLELRIVDPPYDDPRNQVDWMVQRCALELWRVSQDDWSSVDEAIDDLRQVSTQWPRFPNSGTGYICAAALAALRSNYRDSPDRGEDLARLDSLTLSSSKMGYRTFFNINAGLSLIRARLHEERGNPNAALEATRQRFNNWWFGIGYLSTYLREEGRLAAVVGDTVGAIKAYQHYLALRSDPEPAVRPQVDDVRERLAALVER